jgi:hypothetical protein
MSSIDMSEVAKRLVVKQPYPILMDEHTGMPATEKSTSVDVLVFSVYGVGDNFEHIPYTRTTRSKTLSEDLRHVGLINMHGEEAVFIPASEHNKFRDPSAFERERVNFKFNCGNSAQDEEIIVALKLISVRDGRIGKYILLLSEPMTIAEMQKRRDSVVLTSKKKAEDDRFRKIEMLWGKE